MSTVIEPVTDRAIRWPVAAATHPLWRLDGTPGTTRIVPRPGQRPLELVADPFSS